MLLSFVVFRGSGGVTLCFCGMRVTAAGFPWTGVLVKASARNISGWCPHGNGFGLAAVHSGRLEQRETAATAAAPPASATLASLLLCAIRRAANMIRDVIRDVGT